MLGTTLAFSVCALLLGYEYKAVASFEFDRNDFGVEFTPYVKSVDINEPIRPASTYTMDNLKTLLEVVSTKFSKLKTFSVGNRYGFPYVKNYTYYSGADIEARTAEAAALINRKRNNKSLTVLIGVFSRDLEDNNEWQTGLRIAAEAAEIANTIYPGTVEGIYLNHIHTSYSGWANLTLAGIRKLRSLTAGQGLSLGTQQWCHDLSPYEPSGSSINTSSIWKVRKQIVLESDFIICYRRPYDYIVRLDVDTSFLDISRDIRKGVENVGHINPKITPMCYTFWPAPAKDLSLKRINEFKTYWWKFNDFAKKHAIRTYMDFAFQSTNHQWPNLAWWRLKSNNLINNPSGYIETVSVLPSPASATAKVVTHRPGFVTEASSKTSNVLVTFSQKPPFSILKDNNQKKGNGFEYGLLAGVIGVITVVLVGGLILLTMKWGVQFVSKNARSPVKYTGIPSAPVDSVLSNLQLCLIESNQRNGLRHDQENTAV